MLPFLLFDRLKIPLNTPKQHIQESGFPPHGIGGQACCAPTSCGESARCCSSNAPIPRFFNKNILTCYNVVFTIGSAKSSLALSIERQSLSSNGLPFFAPGIPSQGLSFCIQAFFYCYVKYKVFIINFLPQRHREHRVCLFFIQSLRGQLDKTTIPPGNKMPILAPCSQRVDAFCRFCSVSCLVLFHCHGLINKLFSL